MVISRSAIPLPWVEGTKRVVEGLCARVIVTPAARRLLPDRPLVLAYHNVVPDGEEVRGDRSLHLPQRHFADQLDLLMECYDVAPLDDLLEPAEPCSTRRRVAITFDDAYRGAVTAGVAELAKRGLAATIFVAPGLVGRDSFWWDALPRPGSHGLGAPFRRRALEEFRGDDPAVRRWAGELGLVEWPVPAHAAVAGEEELRCAVLHPGITVASHSWKHLNLATLSGPELRADMTRASQWLRERFGAAVIPWVSYPYGLCSKSVEAAAIATGHRGGLRIGGGRFPAAPLNVYRLPRANIPSGITRSGFALRAAGLTGEPCPTFS